MVQNIFTKRASHDSYPKIWWVVNDNLSGRRDKLTSASFGCLVVNTRGTAKYVLKGWRTGKQKTFFYFWFLRKVEVPEWAYRLYLWCRFQTDADQADLHANETFNVNRCSHVGYVRRIWHKNYWQIISSAKINFTIALFQLSWALYFEQIYYTVSTDLRAHGLLWKGHCSPFTLHSKWPNAI